MPVPKAAVHEYRTPQARENEVRCARQVSAVKPKSITESMNKTSDLLLWRGVV